MGLPFKKDYTRKYLRYRYRIRELIKPALDIYSKNKVPVTNQVNAYSIAQQRRSSYKYVRHLFKKKDSQYYSKFSNRLYYSNLLGTSVNKYLLRKTGFWKNFISQAPSGYRLRQDVASFQDIWGNRFIKIKRKRKDQGESLIKFFQPGWIARLNNPIKYSNNYRNKSSTFTVNGVRMKHRHIPSTANTQLFLTQADVVAYKNTPINRIKIGTKDKMHDLSQISDEIEQYMSEMAKKGF